MTSDGLGWPAMTPLMTPDGPLVTTQYSEALGFSFSVFDIFDGDLHKACDIEEIDYVIVSYVCIYVAKQVIASDCV